MIVYIVLIALIALIALNALIAMIALIYLIALIAPIALITRIALISLISPWPRKMSERRMVFLQDGVPKQSINIHCLVCLRHSFMCVPTKSHEYQILI